MKRINSKLLFVSLILPLFGWSHAWGAQIAASGYTQSAVQAAVNSANDGDTVSVPAGSATWASPVTWSDKNINVIGAGIGKTNITVTGSSAFSVTDGAKANFRISGMSIGGVPSGGYFIQVSSYYQTTPQWVYGWQIDHIAFNEGSNATISVYTLGVNWGLIDNCTFTGSHPGADSYDISVRSYYYYEQTNSKYLGSYDWSLPLDLGTYKALYIEQCTFNNTGTSTYHPFLSQGGGRVVFRHNTVSGLGSIYFEGAMGTSLGPCKYEIYNNTWVNPSALQDSSGHGAIFINGGGTGVIFDNTIDRNTIYANAGGNIDITERRATDSSVATLASTYACNGTRSWDGSPGVPLGNTETTGWPCIGQIGRASGASSYPGGISAPLYMWNNGTDAGCSSGGSCSNNIQLGTYGTGVSKYVSAIPHSNGDVDYVNNGTTAEPGYSPYAYPDPLEGGQTTGAPAAPTGVHLITQ